MGRRPKNAPKDVPLGPPKKLTQKQFELLAHILIKSWGAPQEHKLTQKDRPVVWSGKAFLERSATKAEAATLSRRLTTLEHHGLVDKSGRYVRVTDDGKKLLRVHLREHQQPNDDFEPINFVLDFNESAERLAAIELTIKTARRYGRDSLLVNGKGVLPDLFEDEMIRLQHIAEHITELYSAKLESIDK